MVFINGYKCGFFYIITLYSQEQVEMLGDATGLAGTAGTGIPAGIPVFPGLPGSYGIKIVSATILKCKLYLYLRPRCRYSLHFSSKFERCSATRKASRLDGGEISCPFSGT
jgi:hypothetical protein